MIGMIFSTGNFRWVDDSSDWAFVIYWYKVDVTIQPAKFIKCKSGDPMFYFFRVVLNLFVYGFD